MKVPEKVPGSLGGQVQRVPEKVAEKAPEKVLGIFGTGPGQVQQVQQGFQRLVSQHASERFVKMKFAAVEDTTETYFKMCNLVRLLAMNPVVLLIYFFDACLLI